MSLATARGAALQTCPDCGWLSPLDSEACPRCDAGLESRKPDSLRRTLALVVAAALLYIPANMLPVMRVVSLGQEQSDTILGGIHFFLRTGSWPLALLIFMASVVVPLLKLAILSFLIFSIRRRSRWNPHFRARLYRLTVRIGRWSMVDIFVVTLMVALVEMGSLATIEPGPGALVFALVVVTTMLASHSFDPRLIWDALESEHE